MMHFYFSLEISVATHKPTIVKNHINIMLFEFGRTADVERVKMLLENSINKQHVPSVLQCLLSI